MGKKPTPKPSGKPSKKSTFLRYEQLLQRAYSDIIRVRDMKVPPPGHPRNTHCRSLADYLLGIVEDICQQLANPKFDYETGEIEGDEE